MLVRRSIRSISSSFSASASAMHVSMRTPAPETLLDKANTSKDVFADSAYRSAEAEEKLAARGFRSRICVRGARRAAARASAVEGQDVANRAKKPHPRPAASERATHSAEASLLHAGPLRHLTLCSTDGDFARFRTLRWVNPITFPLWSWRT